VPLANQSDQSASGSRLSQHLIAAHRSGMHITKIRQLNINKSTQIKINAMCMMSTHCHCCIKIGTNVGGRIWVMSPEE
jgi:exosome complex RNA-binding protein Rrp4